MAKETKSTISIAMISAISAIVIAAITTYGTIAVSAPEAKKVKKELEEISELQLIANLPVGTIVPSMLEPSVFAEAVGDGSRDTPQWELADGRPIALTSRYSQKSGATATPDLRGVFLRGMNVNGGKDPDMRAAGDYQEDALQQHGHGTKFTTFIWSDASTDYGYTSKGEAHAPLAIVGTVTDANVADETRPKNVAVYFYIKIN